MKKLLRSGCLVIIGLMAVSAFSDTVSVPVINPPGGIFDPAVRAYISCATDGATIRYTTNGSEPTSGSTVYSGPIYMTSTMTLKAKAFKSGMTDSATASKTFTRQANPSQPDRVILFIIDSLNPNCPERLSMPNLSSLMQNGTVYTNVMTVLPMHPSPSSGGYTWNCSMPNPGLAAGTALLGISGLSDTLVQSSYSPSRTAFIVNDGAYGPWNGWPGVSAGFTYYNAMPSYNTWANDYRVTDAGRSEIQNNNPAFIRLHLQGPGTAGYQDSQNGGVTNIWAANSTYRAAMQNADSLLGSFVTWLENNSYMNNTVLIVMGDNGQADTGWHPPFTEGTDKTMVVIYGKNIGTNSFAYAENIDVAPTISYLKGRSPTAHYQGRILSEALANVGGSIPADRWMDRANRSIRHFQEFCGDNPGYFNTQELRDMSNDFARIEEICQWDDNHSTLIAVAQNNEEIMNVLDPSDMVPPSVPTGLQMLFTNSTSIGLGWTASTDNVAVAGYRIHRDGTYVGQAASTSYDDTGLNPQTAYSYRVSAFDTLGNTSAWSSALSISTGPADTQPPTQPTGLNGSANGSSQVSLSWNASTDNEGVAGYAVLRDGSQVGTTASLSYDDTGLSPLTTYSYAVCAYDLSGNRSTTTTPVNVQTEELDNLLTNGSFEVGSTSPSDWSASGSASGTRASDYAYNESYSLKVTGDQPANGYFDQSYVIDPNTAYTLSMWVRQDGVTGSGVSVRYVELTPVLNIYWSSSKTGTHDWEQVSVTFTSSASVTAGRVDIMVGGQDGGTTWIDLVDLREVSEAPGTVATPTISPNGGTFTNTQQVTLSCATSGADIRYTTNGDTPTSGSTLYSSPFTLTDSATVKARAFKSGLTDSAVASATFTKSGGYTPDPALSVSEGSGQVVLENSILRVVYSSYFNSSTDYGTCARDFILKTSGNVDQSGGNYGFEGASKRGYLNDSASSIIYNGDDRKTVRMVFHADFDGGCVAEEIVTIYPNSPYVRVDMVKWRATKFDIAYPNGAGGGTYNMYGQGSWIRPTSTVYPDMYYDRLTEGDPVDGGALNYNDYFVLNIDNSGVGFGKVFPIDRINLFNLMWQSSAFGGWEAFADYGLPHESYTYYYYAGTGGGSGLMAIGTNIVDNVIANAVADPQFGTAPGKYTNTLSVSLSCSTAGATIRYTTDGTEPNDLSSVYSGPIACTEAVTDIRAKAFKVGMNPSLVTRGKFQLDTSARRVAMLSDGPVVFYYDAYGTQKSAHFTINNAGVTNLQITMTVHDVDYDYEMPYSLNGHTLTVAPSLIGDGKGLPRTATVSVDPSYLVNGENTLTFGAGRSGNDTAYWVTDVEVVAQYDGGSGGDTEDPTTPTALSVAGKTSDSVSLSWSASTDNVGVTGYKVYRNGSQAGTSAATTYTDTGLTPSMVYTYRVSAYDAAANESSQSAPVSTSTSVATNGSPVSLLTNPSFEDGTTVPSNWGQQGGASGTRASDQSQDQTYAMKVEGNQAGDAYFDQTIALDPSTGYTLSFWLRQDGVTGSGVRARYVEIDPAVIQYLTPELTGTRGWEQVSVSFTTSASIANGRVDILVGGMDAGTTWLDNVYLGTGEAGGIVDTDSDGIVDSWENAMFGNLTTAGADTDTDGDGMTDLHEYIAATQPTNAASVLQLEMPEIIVGNDTEVRWQSVPGRLYTLERASSLTSSFVSVMSNVSAADSMRSVTVNVDTARAYFRVKVEE